MFIITLLAPSFISVLVLLIVNTITIAISFTFSWSKLTDLDPVIVDQMLFWFSSFVVVDIMFFVLLQKRELTHFFSIQDLKKKQVQMTNVFNA